MITSLCALVYYVYTIYSYVLNFMFQVKMYARHNVRIVIVWFLLCPRTFQ